MIYRHIFGSDFARRAQTMTAKYCSASWALRVRMTMVLRPTVAGVLMASADPRRWLPNAYIQAVAYRGDQIQSDAPGGYQLDAADIAGPSTVRLRKPVGSLPET